MRSQCGTTGTSGATLTGASGFADRRLLPPACLPDESFELAPREWPASGIGCSDGRVRVKDSEFCDSFGARVDPSLDRNDFSSLINFKVLSVLLSLNNSSSSGGGTAQIGLGKNGEKGTLCRCFECACVTGQRLQSAKRPAKIYSSPLKL